MDRSSVLALVEEVCDLDPACGDRDVVVSVGRAARRLRGWLDSVDLMVAQAMAATGPHGDDLVVRTALVSARDAAKVLERAATAQAAPALGAALANGDVCAAHVDELTRAAKRLDPAQAATLLSDRSLADAAVGITPQGFRAVLDDEVRRLQGDDGVGEYQRQCANVRLRTGVAADGMVFLSGRFDPVTGVRLQNRLDHELNRLFAERVPEHCPADPGEKQDFLRAHALVSLTNGGGAAVARPDLVVVEDRRTTDSTGRPVLDVGADVTIPRPVLDQLLADARRFDVVVDGSEIVAAPGRLDLGRSSRIANLAQRRALLALYPTCAIPGCPVRHHHTDLHHVVWWEHGGATDLDNLLPLCSRHHHAVHDHGWRLTLQRDRTLEITYPDGSTMTTGPPTRQRTA
jgi:hypothetical protein